LTLAPASRAAARASASRVQPTAGGEDRSVALTSDADFYFSSQVLADAAASLKPLSLPHCFTQASFGLRGGMTFRRFDIKFDSGKSLALTTFRPLMASLLMFDSVELELVSRSPEFWVLEAQGFHQRSEVRDPNARPYHEGDDGGDPFTLDLNRPR